MAAKLNNRPQDENAIEITVFRWAGQKWFLRIRSECAECDLTVARVQRLLDDHPSWPVTVEVKPWLTHLWESLRHGGWHAPVTVVDGRVVCQGVVPSKTDLETAMERAFSRHDIRP